VSSINGQGNKAISISSLTENNDGATRIATIKIKGEGSLVDSIIVTQDIVTSVEGQHSNIKIFPNPASHKLIVDLSGNGSSDIQDISILSVDGLILTIKPAKYSEKYEFDVSNLSAGLYFVRLTNRRHVYYEKLFIRRD
jgi:hypothetical protein